MAKTVKTDADKNLMYALIILALVVVLFFTLRFGVKNYPGPGMQYLQNPSNNSYPAIESSDDLSKAASELDNADLENIDKELNSLDTDSSSF